METVFLTVLNMSITAGWLVLAVLVLRLLLLKAPKAIRCVLWALVGLRLLLPFTIESNVSLLPSREPIPQNIVSTETPEIDTGVPIINTIVNPILNDIAANAPVQTPEKDDGDIPPIPSDPVTEPTPTPEPVPQPKTNGLQHIVWVASVVWLVGVGVMALYGVISYLRMRRQVRASLPLQTGVYECDAVVSPFILGIFRPRIYLPSGMASETMTYVLAHENTHLKRRDHWWKPLGFALLCVHWFNPLLWVGYLLLCRDIEMACDERIVKEMDNADKKAYSEALVSCSFHRRRIMVCPVAFGEVGVKERIRSIVNYKKPAFWVVIVAVVICVGVAVAFLTNPPANSGGEGGVTSPIGGENKLPEPHAHQLLTADRMASLLSAEKGSTITVSQVGLKDAVIEEKQENAQGSGRYVYLASDYRYGDVEARDSYLIAELENETVFFDLQDAAYGNLLYLRDIDGDKQNEVILQRTVDAFGGAGQYSSRIFKIKNNAIYEMFNSLSGETLFDSGFKSEFLNGYTLKIYNTLTDFETVIDISEHYILDFFDENGKAKLDVGISCDSFMEFTPQDVDDDGVFEIIGVQYAFMTNHADGVGYAKTVLKYSPQSETMQVVKADFEVETVTTTTTTTITQVTATTTTVFTGTPKPLPGFSDTVQVNWLYPEQFELLLANPSYDLLTLSGRSPYTYPKDGNAYPLWGAGSMPFDALGKFAMNKEQLQATLLQNGITARPQGAVFVETPYAPLTLWVDTDSGPVFLTIDTGDVFAGGTGIDAVYTHAQYREAFCKRKGTVTINGEQTTMEADVYWNDAELSLLTVLKAMGATVQSSAEVHTVTFQGTEYTLDLTKKTLSKHGEVFTLLVLDGGYSAVYEKDGDCRVNIPILHHVLWQMGAKSYISVQGTTVVIKDAPLWERVGVPPVGTFSADQYQEFSYSFLPIVSATLYNNGKAESIEPDDPRLVRFVNALMYSQSEGLYWIRQGYVKESEIITMTETENKRLEIEFQSWNGENSQTHNDTPKLIVFSDYYLQLMNRREGGGYEWSQEPIAEQIWPYKSLWEKANEDGLIAEGWPWIRWFDLFEYAGF